ncbi:hypothetical protein NP233_g5634 [Leucocoprinus birnbaumii]|uniref:Uncharacterized protein n=1 Tax=Leucocoprinus birnbaumii TaxID=56174 RepID=A0AAD5VUU7_9AGAR|nr:hypothetical protein NP233_g5634 [Leucocoprinus birnbaumii]
MPPVPPLLHRYVVSAVLDAPLTRLRYVDPLLGVFTGVLAYYLHETHPRTALPPDQRLTELIRWKREKTQREREDQLRASDAAEQ